MAIHELIAVVPPAAEPIDRGSVELWPKVLDEIGFRLPDDFRDFGIHYGSGRFCGSFLQVFNPFWEHYIELVQNVCEPLVAAKPFKTSNGRPFPTRR